MLTCWCFPCRKGVAVTRFAMGLAACTAVISCALPADLKQEQQSGAAAYSSFSLPGTDIRVHKIGDGGARVALLGGIHGGFEIATISLARRIAGSLRALPASELEGVTVYVITAVNRFGALVGRNNEFAGRYNAAGVDLNRNWGCSFNPNAVLSYNGDPGVAGSVAFSEVETRALAAFLSGTAIDPAYPPPPEAPGGVSLAVFLHSAEAGGAIYYGGQMTCPEGPNQATGLHLARAYSSAATTVAGRYGKVNYLAHDGMAENWLATQGVRAITVELSGRNNADRGLDGRDDMDFRENLLGFAGALWFAGAVSLDPSDFVDTGPGVVELLDDDYSLESCTGLPRPDGSLAQGHIDARACGSDGRIYRCEPGGWMVTEQSCTGTCTCGPARRNPGADVSVPRGWEESATPQNAFCGERILGGPPPGHDPRSSRVGTWYTCESQDCYSWPSNRYTESPEC